MLAKDTPTGITAGNPQRTRTRTRTIHPAPSSLGRRRDKTKNQRAALVKGFVLAKDTHLGITAGNPFLYNYLAGGMVFSYQLFD
ncbi:hypothetical protein NV36_03515 [Dokdonia donghaensis DSW-1]|uniref:Uncharacterized protein n=1 Tax=Dokdonia donghaensis DSW-1 TaxID=1300343 RepID=A0A0A2GUL2_9FLAO|nr:hypothetical protein I597_1825 [Dokdonia donghaensis DSW-1]KGO06001.1 hypothetical protein NV36_03515 [Dokdonia donghaensis DSW-1]